MEIKDLITEDLIIPDLKGTNKKHVLEELVQHLVSKVKGIDADELLKVLIEREKLGSTGIGNGIAIPHGKLNRLEKIVLLFGKSLQGVDFDSIDEKPVNLIFLLVAPSNTAGVHLKALARLSRLLKSNSFREALLDAPDAQTLYRIIIEEDQKVAS